MRLLLLAAMAALVPSAALAQASPSAYTSGIRYDAVGQVTGTIAPNDAANGYTTFLATRTTYDANGRPIKVESGYLTSWQSESIAPASWPSWTGSAGFKIETTVETTYDVLGNKLTERLKGADLVAVSLTQYSYDSSRRLVCTAVRMNPAVYGSLPASACTQGTPGADGAKDRITRNYYDAAGQLVQVRDGVGAGTTVEAAEVTYGYTLNGKIQYVVDAGGHKAMMCYDAYDRQVRWVFPSTTNPGSFNDMTAALALSTAGAVNGACTGTSGDYEQYGYDAAGNRTSLRKRDGKTLTFQYDALNRNTVKIVPGSGTHTRDIYYSYDLRSLMTSARFDSTSGEGVEIGYDGFGRKTSETLTMDGVSRTMASQYDKDGNRTRLTYPDGNYVDFQHDGLDRFYDSDVNGSPLFHPTYDVAGRQIRLYRWSTATASWSMGTGFTYTPASRLESHWFGFPAVSYNSTTTFTYNPANQIASFTRSNDMYAFTGYAGVNRNYASNGLNQYSAVGGTNFSYDLNGNLTSDGTDTFAYDVENRLISRSGSVSAALRYDPLGRLYQANGPGPTRRFLYDGDALVGEYDPSGTLLRRYVHGAGAGDDPLVWFEGSGVANSARRYLYADERGSIVAVTDSVGNVTTVNRYDEYGIPASGNVGAFQYTGQVWLPELGMYYYKARMYSPTLGRFLQIDPIGYEDQFNLYAYVGNDPVNSVDFDGQESASIAVSSIQSLQQARIDNPRTPQELAAEREFTLGVVSLLPPVRAASAAWTVRGAWVAVTESMSARALAYQIAQGGRSGMAYLLNGVKFDARIGRTLIEAKSSLANFVGRDGAFRPWFRGADALVSQAQRQLNAARGLNITWKVQDARTAGAINRLFRSNDIQGIKVEVSGMVCTGSRIARAGGC